MTLPFTEQQKDGYIIREFSQDTPSLEFVWHRDLEDRYIQAVHKTDWKFQLDNEFPQEISETKLFIKKKTYHRLIKGTGDLKLKIYKV